MGGDERLTSLRFVLESAAQWLASILPPGFDLEVSSDGLRISCFRVGSPSFVTVDFTRIATGDELIDEVETDTLHSMLNEVQDLVVEDLRDAWPNRLPVGKELPVPRVERDGPTHLRLGYADREGWVAETSFEVR
jgi:hypothetical protein